MPKLLSAPVQEWSYFRGGLSTIDRDYGIFNKIHHDIGTHVVHHLFPQMPHYHLTEATEVKRLPACTAQALAASHVANKQQAQESLGVHYCVMGGAIEMLLQIRMPCGTRHSLT